MTIYLCELFQKNFYLYPDWYSDAEEKTDFQWEFLKKPHFSFRIYWKSISKQFLQKYVDTSQGKSFVKSLVNLSRSRYSKGQKGKKN